MARIIMCEEMTEGIVEGLEIPVLGKNNSQICSNSLLSFKKEYQNYLSSLVAVD